jgi:nanoRNase/pAp phosphatase (c-di-AMP/oligoRNAs hydrolase)
MVCTGIFKNQIYYSIRAKEIATGDVTAGDAAERMADIFGGSGGGHSNMAAGRIPINKQSPEFTADKFMISLKEIYSVSKIEGLRLLE